MEKKSTSQKNKKINNVGTLTKEEIKERDELNEYIRDHILCYDSGKALPKYLWHRINSFRQGKTFSKGGTANVHMYYSYKEILITFKFCKNEIRKCLKTMEFNNEAHKINTIMTYIDKNINTIKDRMRSKQRVEEKVQNEDMSKFDVEGIEDRYTVKSQKTNPELERYW